MFNHRKKWSSDICYNSDGPRKHYAKQKKPDTNTVWFYLHEISRIVKTVEAESRLEVTRVELGAGEIENHWLKGIEFLLAVMKKKINSGDGCTT